MTECSLSLNTVLAASAWLIGATLVGIDLGTDGWEVGKVGVLLAVFGNMRYVVGLMATMASRERVAFEMGRESASVSSLR